jgi:hypothetical protein
MFDTSKRLIDTRRHMSFIRLRIKVSAYLSVETSFAFSAQLVVVCAQGYLIVAEAEEVPYPRVQANKLKEMRHLGQRSCHSR